MMSRRLRIIVGREFLVDWEDTIDEETKQTVSWDPSWEPEIHCNGCLDLLQDYCRVKGIPFSENEALIGADPADEGHNMYNWITMNTVLEEFAKQRSRLKIKSPLTAAEWTKFGKEDQLYFLRHEQHCYVLLHVNSRNLAFIADGGNKFRRDRQVANELKQRLNIRLVSLEFSQQLKIDHCGSSAILIGIELLRLHNRGFKFQRLSTSKSLRYDLTKYLHTQQSKPVEQVPLREKRKALACEICGKTFKSTQGRSLTMHLFNNHRSK